MKIIPVGHSLSLFLLVSYLLCVGWGSVTPSSLHMHPAWQDLLPFLYGWYIALLFVPLFNFFNRNSSA